MYSVFRVLEYDQISVSEEGRDKTHDLLRQHLDFLELQSHDFSALAIPRKFMANLDISFPELNPVDSCQGFPTELTPQG